MKGMRKELLKSIQTVATGTRVDDEEEERSKRRIWRSRDSNKPETRKRFWMGPM
jgi:hypothetical protein